MNSRKTSNLKLRIPNKCIKEKITLELSKTLPFLRKINRKIRSRAYISSHLSAAKELKVIIILNESKYLKI